MCSGRGESGTDESGATADDASITTSAAGAGAATDAGTGAGASTEMETGGGATVTGADAED